jgi:iron(III) transport system substrate-binding protein
MTRFLRMLGALVALALLAGACGDDDADTATDDPTTTTAAGGDQNGTEGAGLEGTLVVYSGRGEDLVQPIVDRFTDETGIEVEVRYGNSAEMLLLIQEEGANSPADVYYSQGAGFLGTLSADGGLAELPDEILDRVIDPELRSPEGDWVGITGRARTVVYNTDVLSEDEVPDSLTDFTDPEWSGRIGWAPTNASFQDHVTALRFLLGEDEARDWLEGIMANNPVEFENNGAILQGVADGEVDVGLVNHYYLYRILMEEPDFPVANKYYTDGDPGALVNIAGAGVLATSDQQELAHEFLRFLLSAEGQQMFVDANSELPVVDEVDPPEGLPRIDALQLPVFDLNQLLDLDGTVDLLIDVGAL